MPVRLRRDGGQCFGRGYACRGRRSHPDADLAAAFVGNTATNSGGALAQGGGGYRDPTQFAVTLRRVRFEGLPRPGNIAVDAGSNSFCTLSDQRGYAGSDAFCDVGAVEASGAPFLGDVFADGFE